MRATKKAIHDYIKGLAVGQDADFKKTVGLLKDTIEDYFADGYNEGYDKGYGEGHADGYAEAENDEDDDADFFGGEDDEDESI